jgi:hypothetical protein
MHAKMMKTDVRNGKRSPKSVMSNVTVIYEGSMCGWGEGAQKKDTFPFPQIQEKCPYFPLSAKLDWEYAVYIILPSP